MITTSIRTGSVLAGDSAAATAATAALMEFETTEEKPAGLILFYPVVTLEPDSRESWKRCGKGFNLDADLMEEFNAAYVPDPAQRKEPLVSPLNAAPESFPPVLLVTAEYDILQRSRRRISRQGLRKAGVPVRCAVTAEQFTVSSPSRDWRSSSGREWKTLRHSSTDSAGEPSSFRSAASIIGGSRRSPAPPAPGDRVAGPHPASPAAGRFPRTENSI